MVATDPYHMLGGLFFDPTCELVTDPVKLRDLVVVSEETIGTVYRADIARDDEKVTRLDLGEVAVEVARCYDSDSA